MTCEVLLFLCDGHRDWNLVDNILLGSVLDSYVPETERNFLVHNHAFGVGTSVHDVDFSDDTDSSDALWVKLSCHLEAVRSSHICVGWHDAKDNSSWVAHVSVSHRTSNFLNVIGLICDSDTSDTWQIDKSQIRAGVGVHLENDWLVDNVLVLAAELVC